MQDLRTIDIIRNRPCLDSTFGIVRLDEKLLCYSLERPWIDNQPDISCVPTGLYHCEVVVSPKMLENHFNEGKVYQIKNVPGREHVLIHPFNFANQSEACISFGKSINFNNHEILHSRDAVLWFMGLMLYEPFDLRISNA